jgi:hypothetical protein
MKCGTDYGEIVKRAKETAGNAASSAAGMVGEGLAKVHEAANKTEMLDSLKGATAGPSAPTSQLEQKGGYTKRKRRNRMRFYTKKRRNN